MEAIRPFVIVPGCLSATHNQGTMIASATEPSRRNDRSKLALPCHAGGRQENELMQAKVCREHGGPEVMRNEDVAQPEPAAREVLIKADAIGVNYVDIM